MDNLDKLTDLAYYGLIAYGIYAAVVAVVAFGVSIYVIRHIIKADREFGRSPWK